MGQNYGTLFQGWEIAITKKLINEFQQKWPCLAREDFDDLLQECLIHWYFSRDKYDTSRSAAQKTFMARVVRNKLANLAQERQADKRKIEHHTISLSKPLSDEEENNLNLIDDIDERKARGISSDVIDHIALKTDLSYALEKLTPQQQKICALLTEGRTIIEVSKSLKIHRSTIYDEKARIRKIFLKEGLKDYLE
jgi:RNA polymerase sigma factor (sigma-70 family)